MSADMCGWVADSNEQGDWFVMANALPSTGRLVDVAAVCSTNGYGEREAKLFAAAPNLLAALRRASLALAFAAETFPAMMADYIAVRAAITGAAP